MRLKIIQICLRIIAGEAEVGGYHTENRDQVNVYLLNDGTHPALLCCIYSRNAG